MSRSITSILFFVAISSILVGALAFEPISPSLLFQRPNRQSSSPESFRHTQRGFHYDRPSTKLNSSLLSTALVAVDSFWKGYPYAAAAVTCGVKASAADLIAQNRQFRKEQLPNDEDEETETPLVKFDPPEQKTDYLRNLAYIVYGSLYQGAAQEFVYNHIYPVMFGVGTDVRTVLTKVAFDLLVQTTLVTLPIAYMSKALIYRYSPREAFRRYFDDIKNHGLLKKYFGLWGPVQCFTFSIVPEHFRVTFIAMVSFFWLIILSSITSKAESVDPEECSLVDGQTCMEG